MLGMNSTEPHMIAVLNTLVHGERSAFFVAAAFIISCCHVTFLAIHRTPARCRQLEIGSMTYEQAVRLWISVTSWLEHPEAAHALAACDLPVVRITCSSRLTADVACICCLRR